LHILKRTLVASIVLFGMASATMTLARPSPSAAQERSPEHTYNDQVIEALLAEGTPRAIVLAATSLTYVDRNSKPVIDQRRRELLDRATRMAPNDAWGQWMAAVGTPPSASLSEPALALQRLEPDNGAVWLFSLELATRTRDSQGVTQALARIGKSHRFNDYYTTTVLEWLKIIRERRLPEPYALAEKKVTATLPMLMAVSRAAATAMAMRVSPTWACRAKEQALGADRRTACLAAGRLMLTESNTLDSLRIGAALLEPAGADDAAGATRNTDYFTEQYIAISNAAFGDPDLFLHYQTDWLQTRDEIQVARNLLTRAGVPILPPYDWKANPSRLRSTADRREDG
jgi:hypothetical protein